MHAYIWDRYYGICLTKYQHTDVVNSVAFNPRDSEMLVTTSDDYTIKVRNIDFISTFLFFINQYCNYFNSFHRIISFIFDRYGDQSIGAVS